MRALLLAAVTACATARPEPVSNPLIVSGSGVAAVSNSGALVVSGPGVGDNSIPLVATVRTDHLHCCGGRDGACVLHSVLAAYLDSGFLERLDPRVAEMVRDQLLDKGDDIWPADGGAK